MIFLGLFKMKLNVFKNSFWMILEKVISIFGLIFVTSYVAKYIGPSAFGAISFAASLFVIIQAISLFGSEHIIFKRVSQNVSSGVRLMHSTRFLRGVVFSLSSLAVLIYIYYTFDVITLVFCVASCVATYFVTQDVLVIYNDATLNSKFNTIANAIGLISSLLMRFLISHYELPVIYLAIPIVTTTLIPYFIRIYFFRKQETELSTSNREIVWDVKRKYIKYLFFAGLPLAVSGVSITLYTRLSQLVLAKYGSTAELGIFSAASVLASSWTFITLAFITSFFSEIYRLKDKSSAMKITAKLNGLVFCICIFIVFWIVVVGKPVVLFLYGEAYQAAYPIMIILAISTSFSAMGPIAHRYIIKESGYRYLSYKTVAVFIINIPLVFVLVPLYGIVGAAISSLLTELISLTVLNYFFQSGVIAKIHFLTLNPKTYHSRNGLN